MSVYNPKDQKDVKKLLSEVSSELLGDCVQYSKFLERIEEMFSRNSTSLSDADKKELLVLRDGLVKAKKLLLNQAKILLQKERPKLKSVN